jgi:hypothetical protein
VSRAYKESTNCRLEAQYAMQREVDMVPLMLVEGYQADGWLGMLIGTRMWYGFYGASASDSAVFEEKVEELCRELGERGHGGEGAAAAQVGAIEDAGPAAEAAPRALKPSVLRKRAAAAGATPEELAAVDDAEAPAEAVLALLRRREVRPPGAEVGLHGTSGCHFAGQLNHFSVSYLILPSRLSLCFLKRPPGMTLGQGRRARGCARGSGSTAAVGAPHRDPTRPWTLV